MDESAVTAARRIQLHACRADACAQGTKPCPCPSECGMPEEELPWAWISKLTPYFQWAAVVLFAIVTLALSAGYFFTR